MKPKIKSCPKSYDPPLLEVLLQYKLQQPFFNLEPSLAVTSHETQVVDGIEIHKLECRTSIGEPLNLAMSDGRNRLYSNRMKSILEKYQVFKAGKRVVFKRC